MRYSIGFGPVRVYGGRQKERRPVKTTLGVFITWLVMCIGGIVWIGIDTHSAAVVLGAISALLFVSFKILAEQGRASTNNEKVD